MSTRAWSPRKPIISLMTGAASGSVKRLVLVGTGRRTRAGRSESSCTMRRVTGPPSLFQCITTQPQSLSAATCTMAGSVNPVTSFRMDTPSRTQIFATAAWRVSTDMMAVGALARIPRITGTILWASSSGVTGLEPGRVDSPPTSMMSAPSSSICSARSTAAAGSRFSPPSLNESGVTLRMPMTRGRASDSTCWPQRQVE